MTYYGAKNLAESFRTVRKNTLTIAEEIPEDKYGFKATPDVMSVGEMLAHLAVSPMWQIEVHGSKIDAARLRLLRRRGSRRRKAEEQALAHQGRDRRGLDRATARRSPRSSTGSTKRRCRAWCRSRRRCAGTEVPLRDAARPEGARDAPPRAADAGPAPDRPGAAPDARAAADAGAGSGSGAGGPRALVRSAQRRRAAPVDGDGASPARRRRRA